VPGNGTFNLTALWRALGIKNPQGTVSERLQPVIVAADLSALTPHHPPPTECYGGGQGATVAEFATVVIDARSPGGCLIPIQVWGRVMLMWSTPVNTIPVPSGATTIFTPVARFSREAAQSRVRGFSTPDIAPQGYTVIGGGAINPTLEMLLLWVPQGESVIFQNQIAGQSVNFFSFFLRDLPAHDNPPD